MPGIPRMPRPLGMWSISFQCTFGSRSCSSFFSRIRWILPGILPRILVPILMFGILGMLRSFGTVEVANIFQMYLWIAIFLMIFQESMESSQESYHLLWKWLQWWISSKHILDRPYMRESKESSQESSRESSRQRLASAPLDDSSARIDNPKRQRHPRLEGSPESWRGCPTWKPTENLSVATLIPGIVQRIPRNVKGNPNRRGKFNFPDEKKKKKQTNKQRKRRKANLQGELDYGEVNLAGISRESPRESAAHGFSTRPAIDRAAPAPAVFIGRGRAFPCTSLTDNQ